MIKYIITSGAEGVERIAYVLANFLNIDMRGNVPSMDGRPYFTKSHNRISITKSFKVRQTEVLRKSEGILYIGVNVPMEYLKWRDTPVRKSATHANRVRDTFMIAIDSIMLEDKKEDSAYERNIIAETVNSWLDSNKITNLYITGVEELKELEKRAVAKLLTVILLKNRKQNGCYSCKHNKAPEPAHSFDGSNLPLVKCNNNYGPAYLKLKGFKDLCVYFKRR